ncbi:Oxidoreductase, short-chain dehydrogenase/reductase family [Olavius sp. associated proteobacterium Delta 1]|nr:Oxidoreductase, short-chain dehydrogenase/reductase family [Olavius sp. associated proteobacterium Delta 1]
MAGTMKGKNALVTGGGSGIGRAVGLAFADEGVNVAVADVDESGGKESVRLLEQAGVNALFIQCDVSKGGEVKEMVKKVAKQFERLDYACNSAGIHNDLPGSLADVEQEDWDRIIAVNLTGVFLCMKYEIRQMVNQGSGVIVNIASLGGLLAEPGSPAYTASKHGVMGLTKVAALECARDGVRINAVCPAVVETPMLAPAPEEVKQYLKSLHPIGRFGKPEEVAAAVMYLCSDLAGFTTGTGLVLDGGASVV